MARKQVTIIEDDLTGAELDAGEVRAVPLRLGDEEWEADLSPQSLQKVREMLEPVLSNARRLNRDPDPAPPAADLPPAPQPTNPARSQPTPTATRAAPAAGQAERADIRAWWKRFYRAAGLPQPGPSGKGRIPEDVVQAYQRHGGAKVKR